MPNNLINLEGRRWWVLSLSSFDVIYDSNRDHMVCQPPIIWWVFFLPFVTEKSSTAMFMTILTFTEVPKKKFLSWLFCTNFSTAYILLMIPVLGVLRSSTWEQKAKQVVYGRLLSRPVCDNCACAEFIALRTNVGVVAYLRVSDSAGDTAQSSGFTVQLGCKHPRILFSQFLSET